MEYVCTRGARYPALGFGTWQLTGDDCRRAVCDALEIGYRHIDTARAYGNEAEVGAAIRTSGLPRPDLWLVTKIPHGSLHAGDARASLARSLELLGTDYVDLLLIHWPNPEVPLEETLEAMCDLRERGQTRHIGVSNFPASLMSKALDTASIVCNQVELHPFLDQQQLIGLARALEISLTAYSPLARGRVMGDAVLRAIGRRYGKSPAQVTLRWILDHGNLAAVPKAASREHAAANFDIFDFELTPDDQAVIHSLAGDERLLDPSWAPAWER